MKTTVIKPHNSSLGMGANITALIIFVAMAVLSWIPYLRWAIWGVPLAFYFLEKESKFVKFQASTALVLGIISSGISLIIQIIIWITIPRTIAGAMRYAMGGFAIWTLLGTLSMIIGIALLVLYIYLIIMAVSYKQVELPLIGPFAAKASEKLDGININLQGGGSAADTGRKTAFCGNCGGKNAKGAKFCGGCGKAL